jgi:hypothetical protein
MSNESSIHGCSLLVTELPRSADRRAQGRSRLAAQRKTPLDEANGMQMLGCDGISPQTPGYRSRLAQPVPGSLTRPHKPPIERGITFVRGEQRRNGGLGPIQRDGG